MNPLDQLKDIHSPSAISAWPLAPGWWILLALLVLILTTTIFLWLRNRTKRACIKQSLGELEKIFQAPEMSVQQRCASCNHLLKRYCLSAGYQTCARLYGSQWLDFLNENAKEPRFDSELASFVKLSYQSSAVADSTLNLNKLKQACNLFIRELKHV